MTSFEERGKGFESKYAHDEELAFKTIARRNKLVGLWAAAKLGKSADEAVAYAKEVVLADFEVEGDSDVIAKLLKDFYNSGVEISEKEIADEMEKQLPIARSQILGNEK